jgi:hypothetical protein
MALIDKELTWNLGVEKRLASKLANKENVEYRLHCPVCKTRFIAGDRVVKTTSAKYCHLSCIDKYRVDSKEEMSDEELDSFFIIKTLSCSKINF